MPEAPRISRGAGSPRSARIVALLVLGAFVALCAHGLRWDSPTVDEFAHLPAGYYYLKTGNFQLYDLNPPLPRLLCALPLLALAPRVNTAAELRDSGWYPWVFGTDFMRRNADRYQEIFLLGRLPVVALGVVLGLLVWRWAARLHGEPAGLVALAWYALCPSVVAHAHLATTDLCFALAVTAALYLFQRWLRRPGLGALAGAGVALGLVQLSKFSGVLLYPVLLLLTAVAMVRMPGAAAAASGEPEAAGEAGAPEAAGPEAEEAAGALRAAAAGSAAPGAPGIPGIPVLPGGPGAAELAATPGLARRWELCAGLAGIFLLSLLVLDAGYLFHGVGARAGDLHGRSHLLSGVLALLPAWLRLPLPASYLHGFDSIQLINEQGEFPTWFCGRWLAGGTILYYPLTLLLKTPLPLLVAWIAAPWVRRRARGAEEQPAEPAPQSGRALEEAFLWLPALVLLAVFSLGSRVSYGIRYLLPILPLACIYASRLVPWVLRQGRAVRGAGLALLLAYPPSVLLATPDTISYFNLLAGGRGDRYLIDSNLDWGQGLERLRAYLDREHLPGIALAYFGHVDPALYGIRYRLPDPHRPGLAAVSVNFLHGYPYVTDIAGHMVPVPADAYTWIAQHPRRADLGGGLFVFEIGGAASP
jgi:hypothetical protein